MSKVLDKLDDVITKEYSNIAGIVIYKDNELIYQKHYNNYNIKSVLHISSVTKSIVSLLLGIAIDKGYIKSEQMRVLDFFDDYNVKRGEKLLQTIKIKDVITMTVPYKYKSTPYTKHFTSNDWVKSSLDFMGGKGKVGEFIYAPVVGPDIISGIITKATGISVLKFAKKYLFKPLCIKVGKSVRFSGRKEYEDFVKNKTKGGWICDPNGVNTAGWGLTLSAQDMAKIGQLCLNDGLYNNKRIVSKQWLQKSFDKHATWQKLNASYGYMWWTGIGSGYAAIGDSGNIIYVNPTKSIVVAIASSFYPRAKDRLELIKEHIEPML